MRGGGDHRGVQAEARLCRASARGSGGVRAARVPRRVSSPLQFHQDLPGRGLEGVDDARAFVGHGLDHGLVAEAEEAFDLRDAHSGGHVPLVELEDVGNRPDVEAVFLEVGGQVRDGLDVGFHAGLLAVRHEDDAIATTQDELAAGVVEDLAGHGVEVEAHLEALDRAHVEGQEVEEQGAVRLGGQAHQLAALLRVGLLEDPLDVRGLPAEAGTVVDDLAVDLARCVVDEGHGGPWPSRRRVGRCLRQ